MPCLERRRKLYVNVGLWYELALIMTVIIHSKGGSVGWESLGPWERS